MNTKIRPLLAADAQGVEIKFPVLISPKLDGIRCLMIEGLALTRSLKPIANRWTRRQLELNAEILDGVDGELMVGSEFNSTTSGIMTHLGQPNFSYHLFDIHNIDEGFNSRFNRLKERDLPDFCKIVPHHIVNDFDELSEHNIGLINQGFEGIMIRSINGRYKYGRSTTKEGILFKLKPFEDSEARIIGFEELEHNENELTVNELGYSSRSTQKDGKVGADTLGKFIVVGTEDNHYKDVEFRIGTGQGLTLGLRKEIWENQEKYKGKLIKFKYQKIGSIDKPRIPIFLGFRDKRDL